MLTSPRDAICRYTMKIASALLILVLAGCDGTVPDPPRNFADPAVAEALSEPLLTDLDMHGATAPDAIGPTTQPATMQIPPDAVVDTIGAATLGQVAAARVREPGFAGCNPAIGYTAQWSLRLPRWLQLPDGAHLAEAAGSDRPGCALRIIRFGMIGTPAQMLDRYAVIAKRAGFGIGRGPAMLRAARLADGAAFRIDTTAVPNGSRIDLVTNRGR